MSGTRTSTRRHRILPARYQEDERSSSPSSQNTPTAAQSPTATAPASAITTTVTAATTSPAPRGMKRTRSTSSSRSSHLPRKRPITTNTTQPHINPQRDDDALPPADRAQNPSAQKTPLPRITVPLDIDVTHVQLPIWLDMSTNYWPTWRHMYDKWQIQKRFACVNARLHDTQEGVDLALREIDRLLHIREKLLLDYPDRQDVDLREARTVRRVWRFLRKCQGRGEDVAKFNCGKVERMMRWDFCKAEDDDDGRNEAGWEQVSNFLIDRGNEGQIFIDPRTYYDHYSWCVEDFAGKVTQSALEKFYSQFTCRTETDVLDRHARETIDCEKCSPPTAEHDSCEHSCLLCLPQTETVPPISPLSSLPSPTRTPGTQSLPSYFKGRRLPHPPPEKKVEEYRDEDAVDVLLSFSGVSPRKRRRG